MGATGVELETGPGPAADGAAERVLRLSGEIDVAVVRVLREMVQRLWRQHPDRVVIDASGVTFLDSAGTRSLVAARRLLTARGAQVVLRRPSPPTQRTLAILGLRHAFAVEPVG